MLLGYSRDTRPKTPATDRTQTKAVLTLYEQRSNSEAGGGGGGGGGGCNGSGVGGGGGGGCNGSEDGSDTTGVALGPTVVKDTGSAITTATHSRAAKKGG